MPQENLLRHETSPYLLQHAENPVHWRPWGQAALEQARVQQRPILLSIGYAACHWCHVMAHESFENAETAALMNALFVCIKVDREERPDVDQLYMAALHALGEQGGWPLTMFLNSDGAPFWGGTYFPPEPRHGRPSFPQVLRGVAEAHDKDPASIRENTRALTGALARQAIPMAGVFPSPAALQRLATNYLRLTDTQHGGLRGAPKFPNAPVFRWLWQCGWQIADQAMCDAVHLLLQQMTRGGIYDQLGGGYARYSTDPVWLAPHFEKMLYDNAQLLDLLASTFAAAPSVLYRDAAEQTVGWLLRDMQTAPLAGNAAFAASEDADSEGQEGRFYVWDDAEIDALLGSRAPAFKAAYDVTPGGNWEGHTILRRLSPATDPTAFVQDRACLLAARSARTRPGRDDKVLADWNGLIIAALARGAGIFNQPGWLAAASSAYAFIRDQLAEPDGTIAHAWRIGRITARGLLDDQAAMARAALALFEASGAPAYLADAGSLVAAAYRHFGAPDGSFFLTAADATDVPLGAIARQRSAADGATPSGNSLMAEVLARLYHLTGEDRYRIDCERVVMAFAGAAGGLASSPGLAAAAHLLIDGACLVVRGETAAPLLAVARANPDPTICILAAPNDPPPSHPAYRVTPATQPAAYLCRRQTCSVPIHHPEELAAVLGGLTPDPARGGM